MGMIEKGENPMQTVSVYIGFFHSFSNKIAIKLKLYIRLLAILPANTEYK
ncbi:hypothetical protein NCCP133_34080 [Cytobacillus sp. NCCP-133]|nr:hypothetical protein NCCP133_34080 [Cytobacillus sp. NCCP-133]